MALPIAGMVFRGGKWVLKKTIKKKENPKQPELDLKPKATKKKTKVKSKRHRDTILPGRKEDPWTNRWVGYSGRKYHGKKERNYGNPNKGN